MEVARWFGQIRFLINSTKMIHSHNIKDKDIQKYKNIHLYKYQSITF